MDSTPAEPGAAGAADRAAGPDPRASAGPRDARAAARARLDGLGALLDDESPRVVAAVRARLSAAGRAARPALVRASRSAGARGRVRARALLAALDRGPAVRRVLGHFAGERVDLERGLFLLARVADPRFDARESFRTLDALAHEVAATAAQRTDPLQRALALPEVLGAGHGLRGARDEFHRADRAHVHSVLRTRAGIPLTLCAIYAAVARRAGLRVELLPLPGHVLLRLHGGATSLVIDPFHRGEARSEAHLRRQLVARGFRVEDSWFAGADAATLLRRQVANLARSAELYGRGEELGAWRRILAATDGARAAGAPAGR